MGKRKTRPEYMSKPRNFGVPIGQVTIWDPLTGILFMRVRTEIGNITAYYQHQTPLSVPPSLPTSQVPPVVRVPAIRFVPLEETAPMPEPPMYDVPKKSSWGVILPITDPYVLLEGCETLLCTLMKRITVRYINGHSNYTDDARVIRVKIIKLEIDFTHQ